MRFTIDSNVLIYAFVRSDPRKHEIAAEIMIRAMVLDAVLTAQALGEFLNVIRRKLPQLFTEARAQADRWTTTLTVLDTSSEHVLKGAQFAARHKLQLWDSIIWQVARSAHASIFLSEDLQDKLNLEGMTVINPFREGDQRALYDMLVD